MADKKPTGDVYYSSEEIIKSANAKCEQLYESAEKDYLGFWENEAKNLHWFQKWDKVLDDSKKPFYKWFINGKTYSDIATGVYFYMIHVYNNRSIPVFSDSSKMILLK